MVKDMNGPASRRSGAARRQPAVEKPGAAGPLPGGGASRTMTGSMFQQHGGRSGANMMNGNAPLILWNHGVRTSTSGFH